MNLRQKAKYYKRLYEQTKYNFPRINIQYIASDLQHFTCMQTFPNDIPEDFKSDYITRALVEQAFPIMKDLYYAVPQDCFGDPTQTVYALDFWAKKQEIKV